MMDGLNFFIRFLLKHAMYKLLRMTHVVTVWPRTPQKGPTITVFCEHNHKSILSSCPLFESSRSSQLVAENGLIEIATGNYAL